MGEDARPEGQTERSLMRRHLLALPVGLFACSGAVAQSPGWHERDYRDALCAGLKMEFRLPSRGRIDCVSDTSAIEVKFSNN